MRAREAVPRLVSGVQPESRFEIDDTYACVRAANPQGYNWKEGRWQGTGFKEVDHSR